MNKIYTGIGSRQTPREMFDVMVTVGQRMAQDGWTLRSGHADGADAAFEVGCILGGGKKEIYLPWDGFNGAPVTEEYGTPPMTPELMILASKFHPNWHACSQAAKKMHARNVHQILGVDLKTPSDCVACWTPNASGSGGTGQAIRIAKHYGIPVFDFADPNQRDAFVDFIQ